MILFYDSVKVLRRQRMLCREEEAGLLSVPVPTSPLQHRHQHESQFLEKLLEVLVLSRETKHCPQICSCPGRAMSSWAP